MGKSGPRNSNIKIIDRPELKSPVRNMLEHTVTTFLWALWIYWILPVVTICLWALGVRMTYLTLFDPDHIRELSRVLVFGGLSILAVFTINLIWINYNYHFIHKKFRGRRRQGRPKTGNEISDLLHVEHASMLKVRHHNRFEMSFTDQKLTIVSAETVPHKEQAS